MELTGTGIESIVDINGVKSACFMSNLWLSDMLSVSGSKGPSLDGCVPAPHNTNGVCVS